MHRQKVKLLLWFVVLFSVLALIVVPALAIDGHFTLKVEKAGEGTGTVTSDPAGINCGAVCEATFGHVTSGKLMGTGEGTQVILTATPDAGFAFVAWGGNCGCTLAPFLSGAGFEPGAETCIIQGQPGETRTCTADFGYPVGGIAVPVDKLGLLAPWLGLAALALFATLTVGLVRRRRGA
jgi:hypothetical protein